MEVTWGKDPDIPGRTRIIIGLDEADDPSGVLYEALIRGRLETLLTVLGRPANGGVSTEQELKDTLWDFAFMAYTSGARLDDLLLRARDQYGLGWGTIATLADRPRSTIKDRITSTRRAYAAEGQWYDATGLHFGEQDKAERITTQRERGQA
ncbi:hypothetical protein ACFY4C_40085 [Actinomadura viridis]|uniref:hypothetical protein n=1 Tax=Actinomadura viridis TaxID=58110 RepID=UPI0036A3FF94